MSTKIDKFLGCEVRSVIRFLTAKRIKGSEIHRQLAEVYGDTLSERSVRKWCRMFKKGRSNVHFVEKSGRPSIVSNELKEQVNAKVQENKRLTVSELHELFPQVSRSLMYEIVTERLHYKKTNIGWVPKETTIEQYPLETIIVCSEGDLDLSDSGVPSVDGNDGSDGAGPAERNDEGSSFSHEDFESCDLSDVKVKVEQSDDFCSEPETKRPRIGEYQEETKMEEALTILRDLKQNYSASNGPNDRFTLYGQHVASKLRSYSEKTSAIVEHAINNILFEADMGNYDGIHSALPSHDDTGQ